MLYKSPIKKSRRSILATSSGIGVLFSLVSSFTFGRIDSINILPALAYGLAEGLVIGGSGLAIQAFFPGLPWKRLPRMIVDFALGAVLHSILSLALWELMGARIFFLTGIVGLLSMLIGELVCARESSILAKEEAELAKEGRTRIPPKIQSKFGFSLREAEVAELVYARASYKDICDRLFISLPTVKSHVTTIYRKSDVSSRGEFIQKIEKIKTEA